uniref:60S ribosomal protein L2, mitochondrial n=1 Tax=Pelargonium cotyledonis TaxID=28968 RepID=A0A0G2YF52_9ROSI|nr:ribosomal protein L2 [Pelargonium cotyledonis]
MQGAIQTLFSHGEIIKNAALQHIHVGNAYMMRPALFSQFELFSSVRRPKRGNPDVVKAKDGKTLKQFTFFKAKTGGRNRSGRITAFHRGGGAKRLKRVVDLKRKIPSMGVVERIEYDPNRSCRLALVRWVEGVHPRKEKIAEKFTPPDTIHEPLPTTIHGQFSLSTLPRMVESRRFACPLPKQRADVVVVGLPAGTPLPSKSSFANGGAGSKLTSVRDVFLSAFTSKPKRDASKANSKASKPNVETASPSFVRSFVLPRIAVAGARPNVFATLTRNEVKDTFSLSEVQQWKKDSAFWAARLRRKEAIPWNSVRRQEIGIGGLANHSEPNMV